VDTDIPAAADDTRRLLRAARDVLFWIVVAGAAWLLWPTSLGGCTTLTIVSGHSMEPTYLTGDLIVSRCAEPSVGDIVVYQPHELGGARIIHRVVGGDATGWQIQGDNNDWVDPFSTTSDEVLGVAKVHVPKVGLAITAITSPWIWASLIVLGLAILVWPRDDDDTDDADGPSALADETHDSDGTSAPAVDVPHPHTEPDPVPALDPAVGP
jgi:signal peptidase